MKEITHHFWKYRLIGLGSTLAGALCFWYAVWLPYSQAAQGKLSIQLSLGACIFFPSLIAIGPVYLVFGKNAYDLLTKRTRIGKPGDLIFLLGAGIGVVIFVFLQFFMLKNGYAPGLLPKT